MKRQVSYWVASVAILIVLTMPMWFPTVGKSAVVPKLVVQKTINSGDLPAQLSGPAELQVGEFTCYRLEVDANRVSWKCISSTGKEPNFFPLQTYQGMTPDGKPIVDHIAFFSVLKPGLYHLSVAATKDNRQAHLVHTILVKGVGPDPGPDPQPDPDPPVPGERRIVVIRESKQILAKDALTINGLRNYAIAAKHNWDVVDPDRKDKSGATPQWLAPYLAELTSKKITLPAILVGLYAEDGSLISIKVTPLPGTSGEAVQWIKDMGV